MTNSPVGGIPLELLGDGTVTDRNFRKLALGVIDTGLDPTTKAPLTLGMRFGLATATWPGGAAISNSVTVPHGLGRTPKAVVASLMTTPSTAYFPVVLANTYAATTFTIAALTSDNSSPANGTAFIVAWVAIG